MKDHLEDGELLRLLDGEVAKDRLGAVQEHLAACWTCRAQLHDLEGTIDQFIHVHINEFKDKIPEIDGPRSLLRARIEVLERKQSGNRWASAAALFAGWRVPALALGLALLISLSVYTWYQQKSVRTAAATELFARAAAREQNALLAEAQPVSYQKVSIQIGGRKYERTLYQDRKHGRTVAQLKSETTAADATQVLAEMEQRFLQSGLDWAEPLSPSRMGRWHTALRTKFDRVDGGSGLTEVVTRTADGPIAEAQVRFRNEDLHAVSETLRFRDSQVVEIAELEYHVFDLSELRKGFFDQGYGSEIADTSPLITSARRDANAVVGLELALVQRLDRANAFLGEQITIERHGNGLSVSGVVDGQTRKDELLQSLGPLAGDPSLKVGIVTPAASAWQSAKVESVSVEGVSELQEAPADDKLRRYFADKRGKSGGPEEAAQRFAANVSLHSQSARSHALAMRQIAGLFTPSDLREMTPDDRQLLRALLQAHARAVLAETRAMRENLEPVFRTSADDKRPLVTNLANDADLAFAATKLAELTAANDNAVWRSFAASTQANGVTLVCLPSFWDSLLDAEVLAQEISVGLPEQEHQPRTPVASVTSR
jgi:hypothetical protein